MFSLSASGPEHALDGPDGIQGTAFATPLLDRYPTEKIILERGVRLGAKILVVDDELIVCHSCQRVLAADGHRVSVATTGEAAIREIQDEFFDLTLLDLRIPHYGGLRVQRAIRELSPQTDVIIITGYPSIENAKESIRLGAFDYVTKPFVPNILRTVVSQVLACKPWKMQERYEYGFRR